MLFADELPKRKIDRIAGCAVKPTLLTFLFCATAVTGLSQSVLADDLPVFFDCELKRHCTANSSSLGCSNVEKRQQVKLIYHEAKGFWFDDKRFEFDKDNYDRFSKYFFAGQGEDDTLYAEPLDLSYHVTKNTIFKTQEELLFLRTSLTGSYSARYICFER